MKRSWIGLLVGVGLSLTPPALANEDEPAEDEDLSLTGGKKRPSLELPEVEEGGEQEAGEEAGGNSASMDYSIDNEMTLKEYGERPYPQITYLGAQALDLDPVFVHGVQEGLELLYLRNYTGAREHFTKLEEKFPGTAVAAVADTLVWQALMLENFDFRFDKQYQVSSKEAKAGLEKALATPGSDGWEHVLMGGIVGIEAIHSMRKTNYLSALQMAMSAMDHIGRAREAAPDFTDLALADGMYNYWRSVVTMSSDLLPDFDDRRLEGIAQMEKVEETGVFLAPMATLGLAFTWIEENEYKRAINSCIRNRKAYPDNIINNLVTGTTYVQMKRYGSAIEVFDDILRVDEKNKRVRYWRGVALLKSGKIDEAEAELVQYLASDYLEDYQKASAHYRLGQVYARQKKYGDSFAAYKQAEKINGHKGAKKAMDRLKERRKEGKIDF